MRDADHARANGADWHEEKDRWTAPHRRVTVIRRCAAPPAVRFDVGAAAVVNRRALSHSCEPMTRRPLLLLFSFSNFIIGLGGFVVIGVLSPIADDFGLSTADAAWAMTAYARAYALTSPVLVALTGAIDRARLLVASMALFALGSLLCATAPDFGIVLLGRAAMAVGAGLVTPAQAAIAASIVAPAERGRALSLVFFGFTIAQAFGVPLGAWLGYGFGWRWAFALVALLSGVGTMVLLATTPRGLKIPANSLATLAATARTPKFAVAVGFTGIFFAGNYCVYTFLAPFVETRFSLDRNGVTLVLATFGICGVAGNLLGGVLSDRLGPDRTLAGVCIGSALAMPALTGLAMPFALTLALVGIWSLIIFGNFAAQQSRLVALDPARASTLLALNAASIYLGSAAGAYIGGLTLKATGYIWLGLAGAVIALLALASLPLTRGLRAGGL
jgi:predicted MFS family arabinose efflux permease